MNKVSIITRAFNRLEYTIKCINSVKKNTSYFNYEHIIINNNSNDGTKEWLNWIHDNEIPFYNKVKPFNMDKNYHDWGGMLKSLDLVSNDSEFIVQMDNDIEIKDPEWMGKMIYILENTSAKIIQLRRIGMEIYNKPLETKTIKYKEEILEYGLSPTNRPVAFFMLKTKDFRNLKDKLSLNLGYGKTNLSNFLGGTFKFTNLNCYINPPTSKLPFNLIYIK